MTPAITPVPPTGSSRQPVFPARTTPPTPAPAPLRWTIDEYRQLGALSAFYDRKTFLLNGVIYDVPVPNPPHNVAMILTAEWLRVTFPAGYHVRNQMGFDVGTENDPGPDLAVVTGSPRDYLTTNPGSAALVIEVAESSLSIDTRAKAELYAVAGVKDYWVLDLVHRQLLVFRDPIFPAVGLGGAAYGTRFALGPADAVSPLALPGVTVAVADLLP